MSYFYNILHGKPTERDDFLLSKFSHGDNTRFGFQWTTEKPTEDGTYWIYTTPVYDDKPNIYIVDLFIVDEKIYFGFLVDGYELEAKIIPENTTHWLGPIPQPEKPQ